VAEPKVVLEVAGREVAISNPGKVFFPRTGHTKLDLVRYYLTVAEGALRGVGGRPMALKRFVNGADSEPFFQKRAPEKRPDWIETVELRFPSGRTADEVVVTDEATLAWVINLGCIDLNPHPVRVFDLDHPDELRVDLDPVPGVEWPQIRDVAMVAKDVLADFGLTGWPKTSGSRGIHVYARILPRWSFGDVRRAAVAVAREIERRVPELATSKWWKEERHGVFVDYNQNAKDRTVASAYSIRPVQDVRVSAPLTWEEVPGCNPAEYTIDTVPARFSAIGDPWAEMDEAAGSLDPLLELAARDEAAGLPDAPWPPHYEKQSSEAPRVQPSKRRAAAGPPGPGQGVAARPGQDVAAPPAPGKTSGPTGRRRSTMPLIEIARAASKDEAMAGLERWKARHPTVWPRLEPADVLVDAMRGRSSVWYRIRVNLRHVPEAERPLQEPLEVDYDPWTGLRPYLWAASIRLSRHSVTRLAEIIRNDQRCLQPLAMDCPLVPIGHAPAVPAPQSYVSRVRLGRGCGARSFLIFWQSCGQAARFVREIDFDLGFGELRNQRVNLGRRRPSPGCAARPCASRRSRACAGPRPRKAASAWTRASWRAARRYPARTRRPGRPRTPRRAQWSRPRRDG
jgi:DNA ligase D-like protein (predicted polymerase)